MMERWTALGNGIAKRMPYLVLVCLATGVLLPDVFSPFKGIVPMLFAFMTFQGALSNTFHQIIELFRRPVQLLVILGITSVAMPVAASALAHLFFAHNTQIVCGIIIEYCMPVAVVSIMWVGMFAGNGALGLAAVLVSTVISPFTIPLTLQLLLGASVQIDIAGMMTQMIFMIALPALAGTALNDVTRGWGHKRLSPAINPACRLLLLLIITTNSTSMSPYVLHMTWERVAAMLFILLFTTSGFFWGLIAARICGEPYRNLITMSFCCGLRNISSGTVIAVQFFPGEAVFPVMCGTIFQQVLASAFGNVVEKLTAKERQPESRRVEQAAEGFARLGPTQEGDGRRAQTADKPGGLNDSNQRSWFRAPL